MNSVYWAALGIGGSTLVGTAFGFLFSRVTELWRNVVTAFAAGVMLAAAAFGLFVPAMELASGTGLLHIAAGAALGALFLRLVSMGSDRISGAKGLFRVHPELLFVLAIAIHKFPEGMAGGVGLHGMDPAAAFTVVIGIALQNLPEGAIMIPPLIAAGVSRRSAAAIAVMTGLLNAAGVFAGALWGRLACNVLPLALSFAGGAMLDVIISQMIPQISGPNRLRQGSLVVLTGFLIMACVNAAC